jgi:hypothetical protein
MWPRVRHLARMLPPVLKRPLSRVFHALDFARRERIVGRCLRELRERDWEGGVDTSLLDELRTAFGNTDWSADTMYLAALADRVLGTPGPFLECGSGLTTVVAGALAERRGRRVVSLEQDEAWHAHVTQTLRRFEIGAVTCSYAPLRPYGEYVWFDLRDTMLPTEFSAVFCDGPAVGRRWPEPLRGNWRAGLVPILAERHIRFGEILLDDADDPRCGQLRRVWEAAGITTEVVETATGPIVVGRLGRR